MAAFLGFCAQSTDFVSGTHGKLPFPGYEPGLTPGEQWDAVPLVGKLQILVAIGALESYGEGASQPEGYVHYTKGGLPGYFPPIKGVRPEFIFNLYDPFDWFKEDKDKVRGRQVEINNGRLAMLGIFSLIAESKAPGAVPPLKGLIPEYSGNYMAPFSGDFSLFFVSPQKPESAQPQTLCYATRDDMQALAEANPDVLGGRILGLWDPLGCLNADFWGLGNEGTIGYLRHAEIKHGRVAMAAFLGFCAQSTDFVSGPHGKLPFPGYEPGLTPGEQWDAVPLVGKLQILVAIGALESYGEGAGNPEGYVHYTKGGLPGYFPPIKGVRPEFVFNLYDPFDWFAEDKDKVRGRQVEINNGRLAMLGIFSLIAESKAPGAVPPLAGLIPEYSGNYMAPFSGDFSLFFVSPQKPESAQPQTLCSASRQEMEALAEANPDFLGQSIGFWDPLGCLDLDFWNIGNEATIGYLRHAEIKHGRVAMAGFLGYLAQSTPLVNGPHKVLPFKGYQEGLTPPEQWDAIPLYGKLQIFVFVGMLESYGEGAGQPEGYVHYTKGGLPGYFPPIAGRAGFG